MGVEDAPISFFQKMDCTIFGAVKYLFHLVTVVFRDHTTWFIRFMRTVVKMATWPCTVVSSFGWWFTSSACSDDYYNWLWSILSLFHQVLFAGTMLGSLIPRVDSIILTYQKTTSIMPFWFSLSYTRGVCACFYLFSRRKKWTNDQ